MTMNKDHELCNVLCTKFYPQFVTEEQPHNTELPKMQLNPVMPH